MKRSLILLLILSLFVPVLFLGCSGDDGAAGAPGSSTLAAVDTEPVGSSNCPNGGQKLTTGVDDNSNGILDPAEVDSTKYVCNGTGATASVTPESCEICHNGIVARNGVTHQAAYGELYQDNVVRVTNLAYTNNGTSDIVTFNMFKGTTPFNCTQLDSWEDPPLGTGSALSIGFVEYTAATRSFDQPAPLTARLSIGGSKTRSAASTLTYDGGTNLCTSTKAQSTAGNLSLKNGLIVVYGRHDSIGQAEESPELAATRVTQTRYPFAAVLKTGTVAYASAANVAGCEKCHTIPFLKHGYIYGQTNRDPATDFYTCKACHLDNGPGGHFEWQLVVDDPPRWAEIAEEVEATPANDDFGDFMTAGELTKFAYKTRLMNDVHLSHAKEFPYPQSMSNCVVCHEGKLNVILSDANFVAETCKSCHPQDGSAAYSGGIADGIPYQKADTTPPGVNTTNQLALHTIMTPGLHQGGAMPLDGSVVCNGCHNAANQIGAPVFSDIHKGYDTQIYYAEGQKFSSAITVAIDNASWDNTTKVLSFGFSASGSAGGLSSANIVPTILVGLYGYDTKDFIVGAHESETGNKRLLEYTTDTTSTSFARNSTRIAVTGGAGIWNATANLSDWASLIAADNVVRVEIGVIPTLRVNPPTDNTVVALNAKTRTFNLKTKAFTDTFYPAIVKVAGGCNNCHEALGRTFHSPDRGGSIVICRMCHITKAGGSHLEMQSRSIDSYAHAIHSFQAFDPGDIDFTDPVLALHYDDHVRFAFPTLGRTNCESCHNSGRYNVPDQTKSFPSLSSQADTFNGRTRNIGAVPAYIMGPASRACGGCHRANFINTDDAGGLGSFNSHTRSFGYLVEEGWLPPPPTSTSAERSALSAQQQDDILGVIIEIFSIL